MVKKESLLIAPCVNVAVPRRTLKISRCSTTKIFHWVELLLSVKPLNGYMEKHKSAAVSDAQVEF